MRSAANEHKCFDTLKTLAGDMRPLSPRKAEILANSERLAPNREQFRKRAKFFHAEDLRYLRFLIPPGLRVLEVGCGTGSVLAGLQPSTGVGIDISPAMIAEAKRLHPDLEFFVGDAEDADFIASLPGPFDVILIVDTIGAFDDCQGALEALHTQCNRETRLIVAYYSHLWEPLVSFAEWIGWRKAQPLQNVLSPGDIRLLAELADFDFIKSESRLLSPLRLLGIGRLVNRFLVDFADHSWLEFEALFGLPVDAGEYSRRSIGNCRYSGAQRTRQYRARDCAHAAVLRRHRGYLHRGA